MRTGTTQPSAKIERLEAIRSQLYSHGFSTIQSLSEAIGASLATIRRDLQTLEDEGAVDRVHGGARIAEGSSVEIAFHERAKQRLEAKRALAAKAYELLVPHATICTVLTRESSASESTPKMFGSTRSPAMRPSSVSAIARGCSKISLSM